MSYYYPRDRDHRFGSGRGITNGLIVGAGLAFTIGTLGLGWPIMYPLCKLMR